MVHDTLVENKAVLLRTRFHFEELDGRLRSEEIWFDDIDIDVPLLVILQRVEDLFQYNLSHNLVV